MTSVFDLTSASVRLLNRLVLREVSLSLVPGEVVALVGPNGAGKTTLMRAGLGFAPLSGGYAALSGDDPKTLTPRARALRAAYLPQRPQSVWPISVEALVALGRFAYGAAPDRLGTQDRDAVDAALEACGLSSFRARRMDELSGGEAARAHLARALAQEAPFLMLDEPDAGLDPAHALGVAEILQRYAEAGRAVLFSTHDLSLAARAAQRVVLLAEGKILAEGASSDALHPDVLLAAYGRSASLHRIDGALVPVFEAQSLKARP